MNESQIEFNSDYGSIAASWLGINAAELKTDVELNSSQKTSTSNKHAAKKEKPGEIQKDFNKKKNILVHDSTASFVSGKLQRKLQKAKRRKDQTKNEEEKYSFAEEDKYFEEDSKVSSLKKSDTSKITQNKGSYNSVESIRNLLATTKTKNYKKKLQKKLRKLLYKNKSCDSSTENKSGLQSEMDIESAKEAQNMAVSNKKKRKFSNFSEQIIDFKKLENTIVPNKKNMSNSSDKATIIKSENTFNEKQSESTMEIKEKKRKKKKSSIGDNKSNPPLVPDSSEEATIIKSENTFNDKHSESAMEIKEKKKKRKKKKSNIEDNESNPPLVPDSSEEATIIKSENTFNDKHSESAMEIKEKKKKRKKKKSSIEDNESNPPLVPDSVDGNYCGKIRKKKIVESYSENTEDRTDNGLRKHKVKEKNENIKMKLMSNKHSTDKSSEDEIVYKSENVNNENGDEKTFTLLKKKRKAQEDLNKDLAVKVKKEHADNAHLKLTSADENSDEETKKQQQPFKRKRKKKRSKQKNRKKDHRPDHMKPPHLRANSTGEK